MLRPRAANRLDWAQGHRDPGAFASAAELARARESVALITNRGYDRGRDLAAALNALTDSIR